MVGTLPKGELPDAKPDEQGGERGRARTCRRTWRSCPKVSGSWGSGRLLAGTAFSVVITDDGRVAAGAVGPKLLYDALG